MHTCAPHGPLGCAGPTFESMVDNPFLSPSVNPTEKYPLTPTGLFFLLTHLRTVRNVGCTSLDTHYFGLGDTLDYV